MGLEDANSGVPTRPREAETGLVGLRGPGGGLVTSQWTLLELTFDS